MPRSNRTANVNRANRVRPGRPGRPAGAGRHTRLARRAVTASGLLVAAVGVSAPSAHALIVTTGPEGLSMREPNNTLNRVVLSLVESGGTTRYRVEMNEFGGRGLSPGSGCQQEAAPNGVNIVTCDRITPKVTVSLGPGDDTFAVDPSFPDPIDAFGGIGADRFVFGAGDDTLRPSTGGGGVQANGGNDILMGGSEGGFLDGGEGNDQLSARSGTSIDGGPGDDILNIDSDGVTLVRGGDGKDVFTGEGSALSVDSRDGIAEEVFCGNRKFNFLSRFSQRFSRALVDLVDTPDDAGLAASGCANIDRAPSAEIMSVELKSKSARVRSGKAELRVKCVAATACSGRATVALGKKPGSADYAIGAGKAKTIKVPVTGKAKVAQITIAEQGIRGLRTINAGLRTVR